MSDINIIDADQEVLDLLKEGDGRQKPSELIESRSQTYQVPSLQDSNDDPEEAIKKEVESNLRKVIDYGQEAIKDLADLASSSEHPRPYEAMSALLKSVVDANQALLDVRRPKNSVAQRNKRTDDESEVESKEDIMKASVGDLLDMIDRHKRKNDKNTIDVEVNKDLE